MFYTCIICVLCILCINLCMHKINYRKTRKLCSSFIVRFNGDTPTNDVMWIFCAFCFIYVLRFLLCGKPLPARIAGIKSTHNFLLLQYLILVSAAYQYTSAYCASRCSASPEALSLCWRCQSSAFK